MCPLLGGWWSFFTLLSVRTILVMAVVRSELESPVRRQLVLKYVLCADGHGSPPLRVADGNLSPSFGRELVVFEADELERVACRSATFRVVTRWIMFLVEDLQMSLSEAKTVVEVQQLYVARWAESSPGEGARECVDMWMGRLRHLERLVWEELGVYDPFVFELVDVGDGQRVIYHRRWRSWNSRLTVLVHCLLTAPLERCVKQLASVGIQLF